MIEVPLTVLVYEGPLARTYLYLMRYFGFRPQSIILMVQSHYSLNNKPIMPWLPKPLRLKFAEHYQEVAHNFWPRYIRTYHNALFERLQAKVSNDFGFPPEMFDAILGRFPYETYANKVRKVPTRKFFGDPLRDILQSASCPNILFTGGGIVPENLLNITSLRFIHIHPGFLPFVRGADGVLWSILKRGRPSASCFYLSKELDQGDIIQRVEFPPISFDLSGINRPDDQILYRAIFSFYDPLLRARLLIDLLKQQSDITALPVTHQYKTPGETYHFMGEDLRRLCFNILFLNFENSPNDSRAIFR